MLRENVSGVQAVTSTGGVTTTYPLGHRSHPRFCRRLSTESTSSMISIFQTKSRLLFIDEKLKHLFAALLICPDPTYRL